MLLFTCMPTPRQSKPIDAAGTCKGVGTVRATWFTPYVPFFCGLAEWPHSGCHAQRVHSYRAVVHVQGHSSALLGQNLKSQGWDIAVAPPKPAAQEGVGTEAAIMAVIPQQTANSALRVVCNGTVDAQKYNPHTYKPFYLQIWRRASHRG